MIQRRFWRRLAFTALSIQCALPVPGSASTSGVRPSAERTTPRLSPLTVTRPTVIARLVRDFIGDKADEVLEVVMLEGREYEDRRAWCGRGPKYEGSFAVELHRGDGSIEHLPLGADFSFFRSGTWTPEVSDYNGDGALDFNLGQYGTCNGWQYRLFTVTGSGEIQPLRFAGRDWVRASAWENSTDRIVPTASGFRSCWYNNAAGHLLTEYRWEADLRRFVVIGERRVDGCS